MPVGDSIRWKTIQTEQENGSFQWNSTLTTRDRGWIQMFGNEPPHCSGEAVVGLIPKATTKALIKKWSVLRKYERRSQRVHVTKVLKSEAATTTLCETLSAQTIHGKELMSFYKMYNRGKQPKSACHQQLASPSNDSYLGVLLSFFSVTVWSTVIIWG